MTAEFQAELFERLTGIGLLLMGIDAKLEEMLELFGDDGSDEEEADT